MHTLKEIVNNNNYKKVDILYYCRSIYPCFFEDVNFNAFVELKTYLQNENLKIGYSSHDRNGYAIPYFIVLGAEYIERHFTLDKRMKGTDHSTVSSNPKDIKNIIDRINKIEKAINPYNLYNVLQQSEQKNRQIYRGV